VRGVWGNGRRGFDQADRGDTLGSSSGKSKLGLSLG